ncbi:hypothetical protein GCM10023087_07570 [Microbacterium rhizosphaerae]
MQVKDRIGHLCRRGVLERTHYSAIEAERMSGGGAQLLRISDARELLLKLLRDVHPPRIAVLDGRNAHLRDGTPDLFDHGSCGRHGRTIFAQAPRQKLAISSASARRLVGK